MFKHLILGMICLAWSAHSALPAHFIISKLAQGRQKIQSLRIDSSTLLFNDEDPKNNIIFNEKVLIKDFTNFLTLVTVSKERVSKYGLQDIAKVNINNKEAFVSKNFKTLQVEHTVTSPLILLFSRDSNEIGQILRTSKIDHDIVGLGRLSGVISRVYGAKEHNTYRKSGPSILPEEKGGFLEETSFYTKIKPQIWFNKDTFFLTRFIARKNFHNKEIVSDLRFNEYKVFSETYMFPKVIDVYHNERLYARTIIKNITVNPKIKRSIFRLSKGLKKITYPKMVNNLSEKGLKILNYLRHYR